MLAGSGGEVVHLESLTTKGVRDVATCLQAPGAVTQELHVSLYAGDNMSDFIKDIRVEASILNTRLRFTSREGARIYRLELVLNIIN